MLPIQLTWWPARGDSIIICRLLASLQERVQRSVHRQGERGASSQVPVPRKKLLGQVGVKARLEWMGDVGWHAASWRGPDDVLQVLGREHLGELWTLRPNASEDGETYTVVPLTASFARNAANSVGILYISLQLSVDHQTRVSPFMMHVNMFEDCHP